MVTAVLSWLVMVLPSYVVWRYDLGLYWAWAWASLYLIILSLIFLRRFLRGGWKKLRIIGDAHAPHPLRREPEGAKFAVVGDPAYPILPTDAITRE